MYEKNKDLATPLAEQAANNTPKAGNGTVLAETSLAQQESIVKGLALPPAGPFLVPSRKASSATATATKPPVAAPAGFFFF